MKLKLKAGTTSRLVRIFVQDSSKTDGSGLTGLTSGTSGLTWYYCRVGDSSTTAVTLAAGTLGTFSSGGIVAVDGTNMPGAYELGIPNAALAAGSTAVHMMLKGAANMAPVLVEIELDAVDYQDATAFGLSRIDAAISTRSTYAGADTAGTTTLLTRIPGTVQPQTGDAYARLGAPTGASIAADIQTRSTYAGADTSGTTTLLARLTSTRAGNLDNLDAAISTRSTYAGGAVASVTAPVALSAAGLDAVVVEAGVNARQALSGILASACGVLSGAATTTIIVKGGNVTTTRITATCDASGNRSGVTLSLPA